MSVILARKHTGTLSKQQSTQHHAHLAITHTKRDHSGTVPNNSTSVGKGLTWLAVLWVRCKGIPGIAAKSGETVIFSNLQAPLGTGRLERALHWMTSQSIPTYSHKYV